MVKNTILCSYYSSSSGITHMLIAVNKNCVDTIDPILAYFFNKFVQKGSIPDNL